MKLLSLLHSLLLFVEVLTEGVKTVLRQFNASNDDGVAFTLGTKSMAEGGGINLLVLHWL